MDDFIQGLECIQGREAFLVPRYDIVKKHGRQDATSQMSLEQLIWNRKGFVRCSGDFENQNIQGSEGLYVEVKSGYIYSFFPATQAMVYLMDGTLVFPAEVSSHYHCKVFVEAPWPLRVARMIRRFNRREVFGLSKQTMHEYVGFLVEEARSCADREVCGQIVEDMIMAQRFPETLSNYLDLAYLREHIKQEDVAEWVDEEEMEATSRMFLKSISDEHDPRVLNQLRQELSALVESKHLLTLSSVDSILAELVSILDS
mgnify:CR=1 FL=1